MRLLDRLAAYSFNLYYVKGRDMIMTDYLSHHRIKDSDTSELIMISFCPVTTYYKCLEENAYCTGTRASAKAAGEVAPKVQGADKPLDPNLKPEHLGRSTRAIGAQNTTPPLSSPSEIPSSTVQTVPTSVSSMHQGGARQKCASTVVPTRKVLVPPYVWPAPPSPFCRGFKHRPPMERGEDVDDEEIKCITTKYARVLNPRPIPGIDTGAEKEVLDPEIQIPQLNDFIPPQSLDKVIDLSKTAYKFLPKQGEIDRLLKQIEKKVLRAINISNELRDLKPAYMDSPHFRYIYIS